MTNSIENEHDFACDVKGESKCCSTIVHHHYGCSAECKCSSEIKADGNSPYIGENGNWYQWSDVDNDFIDTGIKAQGKDGDNAFNNRISMLNGLVLYVRKDGNDINDGLSDTSDSAFKTINAALKSINKYDTHGKGVTIWVHEGTYDEVVSITEDVVPLGQCMISINGVAQETVVIKTADTQTVIVSSGHVKLFNLTIQNSYTGSNTCTCVTARFNGMTEIEKCIIGPAANASIARLVTSTHQGAIFVRDGNTFTGAANCCMCAAIGGTVFAGGAEYPTETITISNNNVNVSDAYVVSANRGLVYSVLTTFTGSVTGKKYKARSGGTVCSATGITTYFPGTVAGTTETSGVYC